MTMQVCIVVVLLLWPAVSEATTRYVAKAAQGGNNANNCIASQNIATPKLTFGGATGALACLGVGDILYVRAGIYAESIVHTQFPVSGTQANPITIAKYQNEVVWIAPTSGCYGLLFGTTKSWLIFDGINVDGIGMTTCTALPEGSHAIDTNKPGPTGITIRNAEIKDSGGSNNLIFASGTLENLVVHGTGWDAIRKGWAPGANGIYFTGSNSVLRNIHAYNNLSAGVRTWTSAGDPAANNNLMERIEAHNNGHGFIIGDANNTLRNSLLYNNTAGNGVWQVASSAPCTGNKLYHLTIYGNTTGINLANATCTSTAITNTHSAGNTGSNLNNQAVGTSLTTNRLTGAITECTVSTGDFHLKAGTNPCVDTGTTLATVTTDYDGGARPQGVKSDIGAYERAGSDTTPPVAPTGVVISFLLHWLWPFGGPRG